jgi:outer membrane protein assembly factor BamA
MNKSYRIVLALLFSWTAFRSEAQSDSAVQTIQIFDTSFYQKGADTGMVYIAGIACYGNVKTKPQIIEREFSFKQGDYIKATTLKEKLEFARTQLINTGLFIQVEVRVENKFENIVFISVLVKERWYIFPLPYVKPVDRNFNEWLITQKASLDRVNYGVKIIHNNFSGRNDKANLWLITGYNSQFALKYERPYSFHSLKLGYNVFASLNKQRELNFGSNQSKQLFYRNDSEFARQSSRIQFDLVYRPAIRTRHYFRIGYGTERISDSIFARNPGYFRKELQSIAFPEFAYIIQHYRTDYNVYPMKGYQIEASLVRQGGFKGDMNMTMLRTIASYTQPVKEKIQFQYQFGGILRVPFDQPFFNRQLFGYGGIFMRGLEYYVIDGVAGAVGRFTARRQMLDFIVPLPTSKKNKTKFDVPILIMFKVYGDAGYAYDKNPGTSLLNNKFLYTGGAGVDLVAAYDIALKLEYSFNQFGESGFFFHVRRDF